jgi:RHS repeat-associated protein
LGGASLTTGATSNSARYLPFGGTRWESGVATDLRFTGQRQEASIGLYDYGARYYDPLIGRFVSADSVVPGAGNPQALNRYSYVFNNPLKYTDPSGHCPRQMAGCEYFLRSQFPFVKGGAVALAALTVVVLANQNQDEIASVAQNVAKNIEHEMEPATAIGGLILQAAQSTAAKQGQQGAAATADGLTLAKKGDIRLIDDVIRGVQGKWKLSDEAAHRLRDVLHDEIHGEGLTYKEIKEIAEQLAREMFGNKSKGDKQKTEDSGDNDGE